MANTNRTKGHTAERLYAQKFREIFPECQTARYTSRQMDDAKVDLTGLPFLVQIKAGKQKGMKPELILEEMYNLVPNSLKEQVKLVIHHKQGAKGRRRTPYDSLVTMTFDDFFTLISMVWNTEAQKRI